MLNTSYPQVMFFHSRDIVLESFHSIESEPFFKFIFNRKSPMHSKSPWLITKSSRIRHKHTEHCQNLSRPRRLNLWKFFRTFRYKFQPPSTENGRSYQNNSLLVSFGREWTDFHKTSLQSILCVTRLRILEIRFLNRNLFFMSKKNSNR